MSLDTFQELKQKFNEQEKAVLSIQTEIDKNRNILEALQNELSEIIQRQKAKLAETGEISADEYVELKQQDAGYKARIEYYQAMQEELAEKLYQTKEKLYLIREEAKQFRNAYLYKKANDLLDEILQENSEKLNKIFSYFYHCDHFDDENSLSDYIKSKLSKTPNKNSSLDDELKLYSACLNNFERRTPTQIHKMQFEPQKGLSALINQF